MAIITDRDEVLNIYKEARENNWILPCFCTENLTTTEAILSAVKEHGDEMGIDNLPIIIAITCNYSHRPQAVFYTETRKWDIGIKLFLAELKVLTAEGSPYENIRVMVHLDHIQFDDDIELLKWDMKEFSSIMFDASELAFDENIRATKKFVAEQGANIVIEGACDEIVDAEGNEKSEITSAEKAEKYCNETGVDLIVANLGTEHRASSKELEYRGDSAKQIREKIGTKIVLHGASSVERDKISYLINDGVCKVNIWTTLERDSSPVLVRDIVSNISKVVGSSEAKELKEEGLLGEASSTEDKASIEFFTTTYRQNLVFMKMKEIVKGYLELWYR